METAIKIIRDKFPTLRRTSSTAIVRSGGRATVFGCLCGSYHTTSTDYRGRAEARLAYLNDLVRIADTLLESAS